MVIHCRSELGKPSGIGGVGVSFMSLFNGPFTVHRRGSQSSSRGPGHSMVSGRPVVLILRTLPYKNPEQTNIQQPWRKTYQLHPITTSFRLFL